jgi:hypothetical protein
MTKDEALRLALEALYGFIPYLPLEYDKPQCDRYDEAITAIKAALEAKDEPMHPDIKKLYEDYFDKCFKEFSATQPAPVQEPVMVDLATMELAESVGLIGPASRTHDLHNAIQRFHDLICANATIKAAVAFSCTLEAKDEPVAWKWHQAPVKTQWGHEMVVADLAIDKDNMVSVYCERDQTPKVEAMFTNPPQRTWVGLTDEEIVLIVAECAASHQHTDIHFARIIEAALKERNT